MVGVLKDLEEASFITLSVASSILGGVSRPEPREFTTTICRLSVLPSSKSSSRSAVGLGSKDRSFSSEEYSDLVPKSARGSMDLGVKKDGARDDGT